MIIAKKTHLPISSRVECWNINFMFIQKSENINYLHIFLYRLLQCFSNNSVQNFDTMEISQHS